MASELAALTPDTRDELDRLLVAMALGDGFQFFTLLTRTPRAARTVAAILAEKQGKSPLYVAPDPKLSDWTTPILATLTEAAGQDSSPVLLDASVPDRDRHEGWALVFSRLNIRRNELIRFYKRPLILALHPNLWRLFGDFATDLRSISKPAFSVDEEAPRVLRIEAPPPPSFAQARRLLWSEDEARQRVARMRAIGHPERLGQALHDLAEGLRVAGELEEALSAQREAVALLRGVVLREPDERPGLARVLNGLAAIEHPDAAKAAALEALELLSGPIDPSNPERVARELQRTAGHLERLGALDESVRALRRAVELLEHAATEAPYLLPDYALALAGLARGLLLTDAVDEAIDAQLKAIRHLQELASQQPKVWRGHLANALTGLTQLYASAGRYQESLEVGTEAIAMLRALEPSPGVASRLASALNLLANPLTGLGRPEEALEALREAKRLLADPCPEPALAYIVHANLARALSDAGRTEEAASAAREALTRLPPGIPADRAATLERIAAQSHL